jgi:hypothetical protein
VGSELAKVQVSKIKEQTSPEVVIVFAEGDSFHSSPWKGVYPLYTRIPTKKELNFSKKTLVILICGVDSSRNGIIEKNGCEESGFFSLAKQEGFNEYRLNQQKILFWKIFEKNIQDSISIFDSTTIRTDHMSLLEKFYTLNSPKSLCSMQQMKLNPII